MASLISVLNNHQYVVQQDYVASWLGRLTHASFINVPLSLLSRFIQRSVPRCDLPVALVGGLDLSIPVFRLYCRHNDLHALAVSASQESWYYCGLNVPLFLSSWYPRCLDDLNISLSLTC